ncbi:MAG: pentapeptide repeat-containing protein, partial [Pirellulales bacterium]|nr:pentapeptide repeat-containing protein [Pirellulales bacterium]
LSVTQLYSTASYQNRDLSGITLGTSISGANFAEQNLSNAAFYIFNSFYGTDFSHANLTNVRVIPFGANNLSGANLTAADARGAQSFYPAGNTTTNLILPDGHVAGLDLTAGQSLLVGNYHGNPKVSPDPGPIPIRIDQAMAMDSTGALSLMLDGDEWDSLISFAPGIPVSLGGTLELAFAAGVDVDAEIGRTFQLFDWTGVTPAGSFSVASPHAWDLSRLYTSGEVTLIPEPAAICLIVPFALLTARRTKRRQRPSARSKKYGQGVGNLC